MHKWLLSFRARMAGLLAWVPRPVRRLLLWTVVAVPAALLANLHQRPGWERLSAARRQQVCALDPERMALLERPGPRLGEAAHMLVDCLLALPGVRS